MKQQVNLFSASLLPAQPVLPLRNLGIYSAMLLALTLLLMAAFSYLSQQQLQTVQALQLQQQQLQQHAETLQLALLQRQPDSQLQQQLLLAQQDQLRRQALLQFLLQQQNGTRFSPVLTALVKIDRPELWLERFSLSSNGSSWQGLTQQPASVALWLNELSQVTELKGQQFQQVQLQQQAESSLVQFKLDSRPGATP
ncbi:MAG: PilN domain-containing protein [Alishewanella aestuarii]